MSYPKIPPVTRQVIHRLLKIAVGAILVFLFIFGTEAFYHYFPAFAR